MSLFVVDASVAIKWFVPETLATEALRLYAGGTPLHVPTFFDVEVANIVWKKLRKGEITRADADFILARLPVLSLTRHPVDVLLVPAFDIAHQTQRTVYDCMYLSSGGPARRADDHRRRKAGEQPGRNTLGWGNPSSTGRALSRMSAKESKRHGPRCWNTCSTEGAFHDW